MGIPSDVRVSAGHRNASSGPDDFAKAPPFRGRGWRARSGLLASLILCAAQACAAETIRFSTYDTGLGRKGPGLMMRDLQSGKDKQAEAALALIARANADVLLLMDIDWDYGGAGLAALGDQLTVRGASYPHRLALRPNAGIPSGVDLDGDGTTHEARDALGYGWFTGDSGLAVLSRVPLGDVQDLSAALWSERGDLPTDVLPQAARGVVPLATTAQWVIPIQVAGTEITLITMAAGTPVFDGPEDRNGLRNRDELDFVTSLVEASKMPLVLGRANQDPERGEGVAVALRRLLDHPMLQDPRPTDRGNAATVEWTTAGEMRVDYVLPPRALRTVGSGILRDDAAGTARLVWVDVAVP